MRIATLALTWLTLTSCLLVQKRPCACPGNFACDDFDNTCPSACTFDSDCVDGFVCENATCAAAECTRDADCTNGFACDTFTSTCADSCRSNNDCAEGLTCLESGLCDQAECDDDNDCAPGFVCDSFFSDPTCRQECDIFADIDECPAGEQCEAGTCRPF